MIKNKSFYTIILLIPLFMVVFWQLQNVKGDESETTILEVEETEVDIKNKSIPENSNFYQENIFQDALWEVQNNEKDNGVKAIIIPHHLLASDIIADLVNMSSGVKRKRVFIIGPNHENIGASVFTSTLSDWETPFGKVESDQATTESLASLMNFALDDKVFYNEHSVGGLMPFLKHFLPDSKVIPIVINSYADIGDMHKLNSWLTGNVTEEDLLIYSMDFSHYLSKEKAEEKDRQTEDLITTIDVDKISKLTNDNVDAPMILALALMQAKDRAWTIEIVHHANSFDYSLEKSQFTTSYFGIKFR